MPSSFPSYSWAGGGNASPPPQPQPMPPPPGGKPGMLGSTGGLSSPGMVGSVGGYGPGQFSIGNRRVTAFGGPGGINGGPMGGTSAGIQTPRAVSHNFFNPYNTGASPGQFNGPNAVAAARAQGPDMAAIQAEMARRQAGAQLGPRNAALSGYMMSQ